MPDLDFSVLEADVLPFAATPTLLFKLRIRNASEGEEIHAILLRAQVRIETPRRRYDAEAASKLVELFGSPDRWSETLRSMLWTHLTVSVPPFSNNVTVEVPMPCTYDFEVTGTKYLYALEDGEAPLLFLFSGTIFYRPAGSEGLQVAQIPWEKEAPYRLPVRLWREMMDRYFPNSAWLRLRRDVFDLLYSYKTRRALPTWEEALEELLRTSGAEVER